ncbi:glutathione S-transferase [Sulfitobacter undariae]|uniref:Glutathione S-transferase n=1 Tax=Sulfitobacter undariae TaxID=1563671 RepID=A0A7W6E9N3_9RHOB|nr:glutathione S-transferase [Sulfitobacter undariae]MBB3994273.1 glutathione S-transferase [Sulfitobacter undariae]
MNLPTLYSFRRCPYAMRARLALLVSAQQVELREIVLRDKPAAFLDTSPSGTVPCMVAGDTVLDESLDIMIWALERNDPQGWLNMPAAGRDLIARADGPFKHALDRTKYATRYPDEDANHHRMQACEFLNDLDAQLGIWLFGDRPTLADYAILPFVRQFAFIDKSWFDAQPWPALHLWLSRFLDSDEFSAVMHKYPQWHVGDDPQLF